LQARNDGSPASDIDVLVVTLSTRRRRSNGRTLGIVSKVSTDFDQIASRFFLAEEYFVRRNVAFRRNVKRKGQRFDRRSTRLRWVSGVNYFLTYREI